MAQNAKTPAPSDAAPPVGGDEPGALPKNSDAAGQPELPAAAKEALFRIARALARATARDYLAGRADAGTTTDDVAAATTPASRREGS